MALPVHYAPRRVEHFDVQRIILACGSLLTHEREKFVRSICQCYPDAEVIERLSTPHNRIDLEESEPLERHRRGKRTLVFGEMHSAVRLSAEEGNTCPNYWHFSVYGFCPYGCRYCYLAGTQGVWFSPSVKIYVNLPEILAAIARQAGRMSAPTAFYHGKLQDGLALDPLTAYSTILVPFFASQPQARQIILTKSAAVERLLGLDHRGHTILSWSLNPPQVAGDFESNVPAVAARLEAMEACAAHGYPVRAVLMPIIPIPEWEAIYSDFIVALLDAVPLRRLTLGGICSYQHARALMNRQLGNENAIEKGIVREQAQADGRSRYASEMRIKAYAHLMATARKRRPELELSLCLEETRVWGEVARRSPLSRCNCVL